MAGVRLLSKSEIAKANAISKKQEIDEGLKLSRKVDALRELQSKEESELEAFRRASLAALHEEISGLSVQKEKLALEVREAQDFLRKELSKTKQKRLDDLESALKSKELELQKRSEELDLLEIDNEVAHRQSLEDQNRAIEEQERARKAVLEAQAVNAEAQEALKRAKDIESGALALASEKTEALSLRENALALKEKEISELENKNRELKQELEIEKKQVADQRATLTRAAERIRQNRI